MSYEELCNRIRKAINEKDRELLSLLVKEWGEQAKVRFGTRRTNSAEGK